MRNILEPAIRCSLEDNEGGPESYSKRPKWKRRYRQVLPFEEARKCAQMLNFDTKEEWDEWVDEGKRSPFLGPYVPSDPEAMYAEEWTSWDDFLGVFLPFEEAREYARGLKINSMKQWFYLKTEGILPNRIPQRPNYSYKNSGWISWEDWFGVESLVRPEPLEVGASDGVEASDCVEGSDPGLASDGKDANDGDYTSNGEDASDDTGSDTA